MDEQSTATTADGVNGAPSICQQCGAVLCIRKQVINLALGNTENMLCLVCLGKKNDNTPAEILENLQSYIAMRDCLKKEWQRYQTVEHCPDREGCFPSICFGSR